MTRFAWISLLALVLGVAAGPMAAVAEQPSPYFQDFETDIDGWDVWGSFPVRVYDPAGSPDGSDYYAASQAAGKNPATVYGGETWDWPEHGFGASLDIYMDTDWTITGPKPTSAWQLRLCNLTDVSSGWPYREPLFRFRAADGGILVDCNLASNMGWPYSPSPALLISEPGWYTFQQIYTANESGNIVVTWTVTPHGQPDNLLLSESRTSTWSLPSVGGVGGNGSGFFHQKCPVMLFDNSELFLLAPACAITIDAPETMTPPDAPLAVPVTAEGCGEVEIEVSSHRVNGAGKVVDTSDGCKVVISEDGVVTILNSGGVGNVITITAACDHASAQAVITVVNPGKGKQ